MGKRRPGPPVEQGAGLVVEIATDAFSYSLPLYRRKSKLFEFVDVLERKSRYNGVSATALTVDATSV